MHIQSCLPYTVLLIDQQDRATYVGAVAPSRAAYLAGRKAEAISARGGVRTLLAQRCEIVNLPDPREGVAFLVDSGVALKGAEMGRWDLVTVDPETLVPWPENRGLVAYRGLLSYDGTPMLWGAVG
jgi:hypothetical protein